MPTPDDTVALPAQGKALFPAGFVGALLLGVTLNPINSSIIATALVGIASDLHVTAMETALLVSVLYLVSAVCQPLMGRMANRYGARTIFLTGIILVGVGGLIGCLAPAFSWLVAARAIIGLGTSAAYPTAMTMIQLRASSRGVALPNRVLSLLAASGHVTSVIGLPIGGMLIGAFGWRSVFAINVPLAIITLVLVLLWVPRAGLDDRDTTLPVSRQLDPLGVALFTGLVATLLGLLSNLAHPRWWLIPVLLVLGVVLVVWERRAASPFVDVRALASNGALRRTYLRAFVVFTIVYAALYGMGQWMEEARGVAPGMIGLLLIPMSGMSAIASLAVGRLSWVRPLLTASSLLLLAGAIAVWISGHSASLAWPVIALTLLGTAMGLNNVANQAALYMQSTPDTIGVNSGFYRTASYVGGFVATGLIGLRFTPRADDADMAFFAVIFAVLAIVMLLLSHGDKAIPTRLPGGKT